MCISAWHCLQRGLAESCQGVLLGHSTTRHSIVVLWEMRLPCCSVWVLRCDGRRQGHISWGLQPTEGDETTAKLFLRSRCSPSHRYFIDTLIVPAKPWPLDPAILCPLDTDRKCPLWMPTYLQNVSCKGQIFKPHSWEKLRITSFHRSHFQEQLLSLKYSRQEEDLNYVTFGNYKHDASPPAAATLRGRGEKQDGGEQRVTRDHGIWQHSVRAVTRRTRDRGLRQSRTTWGCRTSPAGGQHHPPQPGAELRGPGNSAISARRPPGGGRPHRPQAPPPLVSARPSRRARSGGRRRVGRGQGRPSRTPTSTPQLPGPHSRRAATPRAGRGGSSSAAADTSPRYFDWQLNKCFPCSNAGAMERRRSQSSASGGGETEEEKPGLPPDWSRAREASGSHVGTTPPPRPLSQGPCAHLSAAKWWALIQNSD